MSKFAILMTSYNHAPYIQQAIDSVLNQSFGDWELFIGDDGSMDDTESILNQYRDHSRIHIFIHESNLGITENIKFLLSKVPSNREYIAFLESDDIWHKNNLKKKFDIFQNVPDIALVYNECNIIDECNNIITSNAIHAFGGEYVQIKRIDANGFLGKVHYLSYSSLVFKRDILEKYGILSFVGIKNFGASDWDIFFRIATENMIYCIDESLTFYRKHSSNVSGDIRSDIRNMMLIIDYYRIFKKGLFDIIFNQLSLVKKLFVIIYIYSKFYWIRKFILNVIYIVSLLGPMMKSFVR